MIEKGTGRDTEKRNKERKRRERRERERKRVNFTIPTVARQPCEDTLLRYSVLKDDNHLSLQKRKKNGNEQRKLVLLS